MSCGVVLITFGRRRSAMRLEITHTVKATNYQAFIDSYKETLAVDREKNPGHKEPRVLVTLFGELNRVRIEFEMETTDIAFQTWMENGFRSMIEWTPEEPALWQELSEKLETAWLQDVDVSAV
jgi:hypothetical protein